jgi:hypothetical protein
VKAVADNGLPLVSRSYPLAAKPTGRREVGTSSQAGRAVCNRHRQCMLPVCECARCGERCSCLRGPAGADGGDVGFVMFLAGNSRRGWAAALPLAGFFGGFRSGTFSQPRASTNGMVASIVAADTAPDISPKVSTIFFTGTLLSPARSVAETRALSSYFWMILLWGAKNHLFGWGGRVTRSAGESCRSARPGCAAWRRAYQTAGSNGSSPCFR